jgi:hypothetical protein
MADSSDTMEYFSRRTLLHAGPLSLLGLIAGRATAEKPAANAKGKALILRLGLAERSPLRSPASDRPSEVPIGCEVHDVAHLRAEIETPLPFVAHTANVSFDIP